MGIAAAIAGAAVIGGVTTVVAGNKAANSQKYAADQSAQVQKDIYDQTRADQAPWRNVGTNALYKLAGLAGVGTADPTAPTTTGGGYYTLPNGQRITYGGVAQAAQGTQNGKPDFSSFYVSPDYQFRLNEGLKAIQNSAAARGQRFSGATMKAFNNYAQDSASQEYDKFYGRLAQLAGIGQTANQANAQAGQSYANGASNAYTAAGNARASAYQNTGNAINGGIQNLASAYLYNKGYGNPSGYGSRTSVPDSWSVKGVPIYTGGIDPGVVKSFGG